MSERELHVFGVFAKKFSGKRAGRVISGSIAGVLGLAGTTQAANSLTWTGAASAAWTTSAVNWTNNSGGTATAWINGAGDNAYFTAASGHGFTINVASVKVGSIYFQNSPSYTLTSGLFNAASGSSVQLLSSAGTNITDTINTPFNFSGTSYAFGDADADTNTTLNFGGAIGTTYNVSGSQTTLSLDGPGNGVSAGTNTITGTISNGTTGLKLAISMTMGGVWKISGTNTYTGITSVSGGSTLIVANTGGSGTGTGTVNVNVGTLASSGTLAAISGAVNAGTGTNLIAPGGSGTVGDLTIGGVLTTSTASTINFDLGPGPATVIGGNNVVTNGDLLNLNATPSIGPGTPLSFGGATPVVGDYYRLIGGSAVGSISTSSFTLPTPSVSTETYSLSTADSGYIDLVVGTAPTGPAMLTWNDTGGSPADGMTWDINYQNWNNGTAASVYREGDNVTFNDNKGPNSYSVLLNTIVHPTSVTVATANAYSISGSGGIANVTLGTTPLALTGTGSLTLGGSNTYTGGTTVGTGSDSPTLILSGKTAFPIATPLTVSTGATVQIAAYAGNTSNIAVATVSTLSNSGKIDITDNDLIVRGSLSLSTVTSQVLAGLAGGSGITSSNVSSNPLTTIGVVQAAAAGTLDGATVNANDIEAKFTYYGDTNLDGAVDGSDYTNIDNGFSNHMTGWQNGDFNYDGVVDGSDYTLIDNTFNTQGSTLGTNPLALIASNTAQIAGSGTAVPEPATLGLLGIGAVGLIGRRRRHR